MKSDNHELGKLGEEVATKTLQEKGLQILERNFSNKFGEIDIIAKDKDTLVFVEVKAKNGLTFGRPEEMITAGKLKRIQHMAMVYMDGKELPCRIDVVAIVFSDDNAIQSLTHYENVYF